MLHGNTALSYKIQMESQSLLPNTMKTINTIFSFYIPSYSMITINKMTVLSPPADSPGKRPRPAPHEMEEDGFELTDAWGYDPEPVITSTEHFYLAKRDPTQVGCSAHGTAAILQYRP